MYSKSKGEFALKYNRFTRVNLDKDNNNFKRRGKETKRKQELEFYPWDLKMVGRKKGKTTKLVCLTVMK